MDEGDLQRPQGDAASRLASEDLTPYSMDELGTRIALLEAEIARIAAHRERTSAHRAAADQLFKRPGS